MFKGPEKLLGGPLGALVSSWLVLPLFLFAPRPVLAASLNVLTLLDSKELVGEVLNEEFRVQTPYASMTFARGDVSSLLLDPSEQGIEGVALRNGDRISGFVLTPVIDFKDASGAVVHLRKEKVKNVALTLPAAVPQPGLHVFEFKNGDLLTGKIENRKLVLYNAYGSEEIRGLDILSLEVSGSVETRVRVTLGSGKQVEGRPGDDDLDCELELGGRLRIYIGSLHKITSTDQLRANLGEDRRGRQASTRGMVFVPGGEFTMGSDKGEGDEQPARRIYVAPFYIDRTEVTNRQYAAFVRETGHRPPREWKNGTYPPGAGDLPVVFVSFNDAADYARWAGKRLPSEEEWEKAARGPDGRRYPWGDDFEPGRCNSRESGNSRPVVVGSLPGGESPYGALDMAGNVWEWTDSWYQFRKSKVFKGGSFRDSGDKLRSSYRSSFNPNLEADDLGFRCALSAREPGSGGRLQRETRAAPGPDPKD